jgi:hypothetical protein
MAVTWDRGMLCKLKGVSLRYLDNVFGSEGFRHAQEPVSELGLVMLLEEALNNKHHGGGRNGV